MPPWLLAEDENSIPWMLTLRARIGSNDDQRGRNVN